MFNPFKASKNSRLRLDSRLQFSTFVLLYIFVIGSSLVAQILSLQIPKEQIIVNTFLMTAILFLIRKSLVIEQHAIPSIKTDIENIFKKHRDIMEEQIEDLYNRIKDAIPLSNVEYITDSESWHHKAISIVHSYRASPVTIDDRNGIFAISTYFNAEKNNISEARYKYFNEVAAICCSRENRQTSYTLIIATGNDDAIGEDLRARVASFDHFGWLGKEFQVKKARVTGIDMLIAGNEILFSLRTIQAAQASRKGIYIRDKGTSALFHRWFFTTYADQEACEEISSEDADRWGLTEEQKEKLNISSNGTGQHPPELDAAD